VSDALTLDRNWILGAVTRSTNMLPNSVANLHARPGNLVWYPPGTVGTVGTLGTRTKTMTVEVLLEQYGRMASQVTLLPRGIKAKDFLGMVMRGEIQATAQQIRAAENLLTIEEPKRKAEGRTMRRSFLINLKRPFVAGLKGPSRLIRLLTGP